MIYLREITKTDLPNINLWRRDPSLVSQLGESFRYVNLEAEEQWFAAYLHNRHKELRLAICLQDNDIHVGNIYLLNIDRVNNAAEFHLFIGEKNYHSQGIGTLATKLMLNHGFENENLNRIYLRVLDNNTAAIKLYEKVGFEFEGKARAAVFKQGIYRDILYMALLKSDYMATRATSTSIQREIIFGPDPYT